MPNDWSFYDVVIGGIALFFTLVGGGWALYERTKNKKDLRYLPSESASLMVNQPNISQLSVLYNGVAVKDPQIMSVRCSNSGRLPITPNDFIEPLTISGEGKILSVVVSQVSPDDLKPLINFTDSQVIIAPLLLNGGDTFTLNLLTDGKYTNPKMSARITDVKEIKQITKVSETTKSYILFFMGIAVSALLAVLTNFLSEILLGK